MNSTITYQFRVFLPRGEAYAIRLSGSEITGVFGPLEYQQVQFSALPGFPYDQQLCDVAWVKANISDFVVCDAECDESTIWV